MRRLRDRSPKAVVRIVEGKTSGWKGGCLGLYIGASMLYVLGRYLAELFLRMRCVTRRGRGTTR